MSTSNQLYLAMFSSQSLTIGLVQLKKILSGLGLDQPTEVLIGDDNGSLAKAIPHLSNSKVTSMPVNWADVAGKPESEIGQRRDGVSYWKLAGVRRDEQVITWLKEKLQIARVGAVIMWDGSSSDVKWITKRVMEANLPIYLITVEPPPTEKDDIMF